MPITHNLTEKEELLIFLIRQLKGFSKAKKEYEDTSQVTAAFQAIVDKRFLLYSYDKRYNLAILAFRTPVPYRYVIDETEDIQGMPKVRSVSKNDFQSYLDGCGTGQYLYFRFTNSNKHFNLGYVDMNCYDPQTPCNFVNSNIDSYENANVYEDSKRKKGVIHKKEEFSDFMRGIAEDGYVYLHKRQYKQGKGGSKQPKHTVILSNTNSITVTSKLENVGGSCCPPQI